MPEVSFSDDTFDFLHRYISGQVRRSKMNPQLGMGRSLQNVLDALSKAGKPRAIQPSSTAAQESQPRSASPSPSDGCDEHPNYGGVRRPRTDCPSCWSYYKHRNPEKDVAEIANALGLKTAR